MKFGKEFKKQKIPVDRSLYGVQWPEENIAGD